MRILDLKTDLPLEGNLLKKDEYQLYLNGLELIERARNQASEIEEQAKAEGLAQARRDIAILIAEVSGNLDESLLGLEEEFCQLVHEAIHKILGDLDLTERISHTIKHLLDRFRQGKSPVLFVPSGHSTSLKNLERSINEVSATQVAVRSDPALDANTYLLATSVGSIGFSI